MMYLRDRLDKFRPPAWCLKKLRAEISPKTSFEESASPNLEASPNTWALLKVIFVIFPMENPLNPPWESIKFLGWTMGFYSIISILWCFFVPIFGGPLWCKSKKKIIDPININRCFWSQGAKHRNSWQQNKPIGSNFRIAEKSKSLKCW